jgi:hypothetical protein
MMHLARLELTQLHDCEEVALILPGVQLLRGKNGVARPISSAIHYCPLQEFLQRVPTLSASGTVRIFS